MSDARPVAGVRTSAPDEYVVDIRLGKFAGVLLYTIARTTPPSTRSAAPVVAEAAALQT